MYLATSYSVKRVSAAGGPVVLHGVEAMGGLSISRLIGIVGQGVIGGLFLLVALLILVLGLLLIG